MKYSEVLDAVLDGKWVRPDVDIAWCRMDNDGRWETIKEELTSFPRSWYKTDTWEIKSDEIYIECTSGKFQDGGVCSTLKFTDGDKTYCITTHPGKDGILHFPTHYQKYKLVPVEDT